MQAVILKHPSMMKKYSRSSAKNQAAEQAATGKSVFKKIGIGIQERQPFVANVMLVNMAFCVTRIF